MKRYKILIEKHDWAKPYRLCVWVGFGSSDSYGFWQEVYQSGYRGCCERKKRELKAR